MRTLREALRVLVGRAFWRDFRDYWHPKSVAARIEALADLRK